MEAQRRGTAPVLGGAEWGSTRSRHATSDAHLKLGNCLFLEFFT